MAGISELEMTYKEVTVSQELKKSWRTESPKDGCLNVISSEKLESHTKYCIADNSQREGDSPKS